MEVYVCGRIYRIIRTHIVDKGRRRERSLTSQLFDANLEAVTTTKLIMRDEKQRALKNLERRKTLRSNGGNDGDGSHAKQSRNKQGRGVKRDRSLTTQLTHKSFAKEEVWKSHLAERRRSSLIRLQERIRENQQGEKKGLKLTTKKMSTRRLSSLFKLSPQRIHLISL